MNYEPDLKLIAYVLLYQLYHAKAMIAALDFRFVTLWGDQNDSQLIPFICNEIKSTAGMHWLLQGMAFCMAGL